MAAMVQFWLFAEIVPSIAQSAGPAPTSDAGLALAHTLMLGVRGSIVSWIPT